MLSNLSPFVVSNYRYCFECDEQFLLEKMREVHPVEGLTVFVCAACGKKPKYTERGKQ